MRTSVGRIVAVAGCAVTFAGLAIALSARRSVVAADLASSRDLHGAAFAGAAACARCHAEHAASWHRTFHRTMTQEVSPARSDVVAGDFSGVTYRYGGVAARMHRDAAGRFLMTFSRAGSEPTSPGVDAVVVRAVGSRRYQQYLADVDGVLWRLPMAFHVEEKRWFHMNGAFLTPDPENGDQDDIGVDGVTGTVTAPTAAVPPQPRFGGGAFDRHVTRWNDNCVFCHNVGPNPGRDPSTGIFRTSVAELGIACESCHGPGAAHVRANEDPVRRYVLHLSGAADPTIVNPSRLSPGRTADLCGRCHGQRISDDIGPLLAHGDPFVPGDDLALYSAPLWRDTPLHGDRDVFAGRFWDDGTPRLTAYEYQGMLQSRCASHGTLTCTSCHGMHDGDPRGQLRPAALGDSACLGCHAALTAPGAIAQHTHHRPAGPGARCVACHMPRIVYGVLDVHPSHRIEIPDPARDIAAGRPDACTLCHVESDRAWAVGERQMLWPTPPASSPPRATTPATNATTTMLATDDNLAPLTALFAGDPVVRALAADAIGRAPRFSGARVAERDYDEAETRRIATLLEAMAGDRYPAVRHLAARAVQRVLRVRHATAADLAAAFDATAPVADRDRILENLRRDLSLPPSGRSDAERIAALRAAARLVDIEIGE